MSTRIDIASSSSGGSTPVGATLMKTGQTTSYRTGDDGDIEAGRATDFFTLATNNPFGNTNRFTDELGGATYTNNIVIDWSTYDNIGGTVLGYYFGDLVTTEIWQDAIDNSLSLSVGTFTSNWRLPNINELGNIMCFGVYPWLNYSPFNYSTNQRIWCSSAYNSANAYVYYPNARQMTMVAMSGLYIKIPCRTFTVTGTTLT